MGMNVATERAPEDHPPGRTSTGLSRELHAQSCNDWMSFRRFAADGGEASWHLHLLLVSLESV
jgi:hypothetical protein